MRSSRLAAVFLTLASILAHCGPSRAGGGPENCLVVVNPESWASLTVANHFIHNRRIPDCNVVYQSFNLERRDDMTDVETFREKLLKPVLAAVRDRGLDKQIDCIAWSSDFPTAIDFTGDLPGKRDNSYASINGLTFLYQQVLAKDSAGYLALDANHYYRLEKPTGKDEGGKPKFDVAPPVAFSSSQEWGADGQPAADGRKYMLSIVLGVTSGRGSSVREVANCLARSSEADGTCPKGTFFFAVNDNIRSTTRQWGFDSAISKLKELGVNGEKTRDTFPQHRDDVMGAMLGLIFPKQEEAYSKTLPGAIVENLTSEGGIMNWGAGQTPISDFIRHGAAGSSGTVTEPNAIQAKFPSPFIFYHYASGSALAEAFYQSVHGPFQLLIVGDPLCQPFGKAPMISGISSGPKTDGKLTYLITLAKDSPAAAEYQAFVDGKLSQTTKDRALEIDATKLGEGYHELSVEAVGAGPMAVRGRTIVPLQIPERSRKVELAADEKKVVFGKPVFLTVTSEGASKIELLHIGRQIATVDGAKGRFEIDSGTLGMGPVRLQAMAEIDNLKAASAPLEIDVVPDQPLPAITVEIGDGQALMDGPTLTSNEIAAPHIVEDMRRKAALEEAKVPAGEAYRIEAYFDAVSNDLYQFQVWTDGKAAVRVDDVEIGTTAEPGWTFLPMALAQGKHHLVINGAAGAARELTIRFGGPGSRDIGKRTRTFDAENVSLHFAHIGPKPPTTAASQPGTPAK